MASQPIYDIEANRLIDAPPERVFGAFVDARECSGWYASEVPELTPIPTGDRSRRQLPWPGSNCAIPEADRARSRPIQSSVGIAAAGANVVS